MPFLDKFFRWKKKPFGGDKDDKGVKTGVTPALSVVSATSERGTGKFSHVFIQPHTSEKAVAAGSRNEYIFMVDDRASKHDVAQAFQDLYGIDPVSVNMLHVLGKAKRFGKNAGRTKGWKKAIVKLPPGKSIDVYKK